MRSLQGLVDSLAEEPYHIGVLAQIGGHAPALAAVVTGYVQMRTMLTDSSKAPAEPQPAEEPEPAEAAVPAEEPVGDFTS